MPRYKPMIQLKLKRVAQGLNQTQLAEKVGVRQTAISQYEKGDRFPNRNILEKIAGVLGCEVRDLL